MRAIRDLETVGYTFAPDGDVIRFTHAGDRPDPARVRPLLGYVKRHRAEALDYLRKREQMEAQLEHGLAELEAATGCSDAEAERLLAHWDRVNAEYSELCR